MDQGPDMGQFEKGVPAPTPQLKAKTPLRLRYDAEIKIFKAQHGGLEEIRQKLGFSRRKMCQLLLVDPSAWTRWMRDESRVPGHVYRALEWFLALNQKALTQPDLAFLFKARHDLNFKESRGDDGLKVELATLRSEVERQKKVAWCLSAALAMVSMILAGMLLT